MLGVLGGAAILYSTAVAPWVFTDSVAYLLSAENLARGQGLGVWTAGGRFATLPSPGYPGLVALLILVGVDVVTAARWIGVAALALLVGVVGYFGARASRSRAFGATLAGVVLVQPAFFHLYSGAMTDPLYITLSAACLLILGTSLAEGNGRGLVLAGVLAGMAALTRYVGAALVPAGALCILGADVFPRKDRFKSAAGYALLAAFPAVAWQVLADLTRASGPPRGVHGLQESLWAALTPFRIAFVDLVWSQVPWTAVAQAPAYRMRMFLLFGLFAAGAAALVWLRLRTAPGGKSRGVPPVAHLATASGWYLLFLAALIGLAYAFADPTPDLDGRTLLAPMIVPLWIWWLSLPILAESVWPRIRRASAMVLVVVLGMGVLPFVRPSLDVLRRLHQDGAGYTSRAWASSGAIEVVLSLPPERPLISNDAAAVHFLTRRPAFDLPELVGQGARPLEARFGDDPTDPIERVFREKNGLLVLFDTVIWQLGEVYPGEADARLQAMTSGLEIVGDAWDGTVFEYPESP